MSKSLTNYLLHDLVIKSAEQSPSSLALSSANDKTMTYQILEKNIRSFSYGLLALKMNRGERVGIYLDKRTETVISSFGSTQAGCVFVPVNPILKPLQVSHILQDCDVRVLVTSIERLEMLVEILNTCRSLKYIVIVGSSSITSKTISQTIVCWDNFMGAAPNQPHRIIDQDIAAIFYTSGSTGRPKGVVLNHRNLVMGATSVSSYLENKPTDILLAALPLSFDAGFSQLTTAFYVGAQVVLQNYLLSHELLNTVIKFKVTGLTAVPPLWIQLAHLDWPHSVTEHLRYFANTGGKMPGEILKKLRTMLPKTKPYLMYGLTEAFRATYLSPENVDQHPDSIGKAIPNAEIMVLREDGSLCDPNEPGELVQRGALVSQGYWNNPEATAERFKPLSHNSPIRQQSLVLPEIAVFSGDVVRRDQEGFLYFIGRKDEMIKTSGYRVSPTEIEEILYKFNTVAECAAFGVADDSLGQVIYVVVSSKESVNIVIPDLITQILTHCRKLMPNYMIPAKIEIQQGLLPRNSNGKIDRKLLASQFKKI